VLLRALGFITCTVNADGHTLQEKPKPVSGMTICSKLLGAFMLLLGLTLLEQQIVDQ
jgi:hypothetical protein